MIERKSVLILLMALAAPWGDGGGFSLGQGTAVAAALAGGVDVLPARLGGVIAVSHALAPRLDLVVSLGGGAVTSNIVTLVPTLALRWSAWQSEDQGLSLRLSVALPLSVLVAQEVAASGNSTRAQARIEGVPVELVAAYSALVGSHVELGLLLPARIFPTVTGELSYGAGLGARLGVHFSERWLIALEATARLEHTTYAPAGLAVGAGLFVIPAGQLSLSARLD